MDEVEDEHSRDERNRVCLAAGRGLLGTFNSRISSGILLAPCDIAVSELCTSPRFERMLLSVHVETLFAVALSEVLLFSVAFVMFFGIQFVFLVCYCPS
jgi:hypothetical protein